MFRRLLHIVLNPFFQALVVATFIAVFIGTGIKKYRVEQVQMVTSFDRSQFYFADLDNDGFSERVHTFLNDAGNAGVIIRKQDLPDEQINFKGIYQPRSVRFMIGDFNGNGKKEVYLFTRVEDSIMLQGIEFGIIPDHFIRDHFLSCLGKNLKDPDFDLMPGRVTDMNGDGLGDLVFAITAGFSRQPRKVFCYDIKNAVLDASPESGAFITNMILSDITGDSLPEILLSTYASDNYNDDPFPYSDTGNWLMLLDHHLDFLFPPVEFPGIGGGIMVVPVKEVTGQTTLLCAADYRSGTQRLREFMQLDWQGNILKSTAIRDRLTEHMLLFSPAFKGMSPHKALVVFDDVGVFDLDTDLNLTKVINLYHLQRKFQFLDIDQDGKDEVIMHSIDHKKHLIYRCDFSDPVEVDFPIQSIEPLCSVKLNGKNPPQLSMQGDQQWRLFDYGINPLYRLRLLIYLSIYLIILGFILLIRKLYSIQLVRRFENEKKMATLQLAGIKAQMEPHFIINVINSIGSSIYTEKKDEAYRLVVRFSSMVRSLLSSSNQLTRTLQEELDFVINYLELEKSRFPELFQYNVTISEKVNKECVLPKMVIQLHAENALKHGIRPKGYAGQIEITVNKDGEYLLLSIRDNGVGREYIGHPKGASTGKGMKILQQLFETYNKHNRLQIRQEIIDLFDDQQRPSGTRVNIWVPLDFNEKIY